MSCRFAIAALLLQKQTEVRWLRRALSLEELVAIAGLAGEIGTAAGDVGGALPLRNDALQVSFAHRCKRSRPRRGNVAREQKARRIWRDEASESPLPIDEILGSSP
jgi:hypothetical protein